jgi:hypothetical protein
MRCREYPVIKLTNLQGESEDQFLLLPIQPHRHAQPNTNKNTELNKYYYCDSNYKRKTVKRNIILSAWAPFATSSLSQDQSVADTGQAVENIVRLTIDYSCFHIQSHSIGQFREKFLPQAPLSSTYRLHPLLSLDFPRL